jgi:hypothetical protein
MINKNLGTELEKKSGKIYVYGYEGSHTLPLHI